ncbi:MAG: glycogen synthase GlgA [Acidobacteria bacterium]|nr:glycogen synthase GlgA [Acidobacteriota bacterium]
MHIVIAASECTPYVKTGGLGDVIGSLPREIAKLGHRVTVYLPYYRQVQQKVKDAPLAIGSLTIPFNGYNRFAGIVDGGLRDGVQYYFVANGEMFDRESLYATPSGDYSDNWERFALFSRAVIEAAKQLGVPKVFHVHDWQASMVPVYLRTIYGNDPLLHNAGTVLTIHNVAYQGAFPADTTERLLLPPEIFRMDRVEQFGSFNYLKGGIVYSDKITTVSNRYAEEIQTPEFGNYLDGMLREKRSKLVGILNGVDYDKWDPAVDGNIAAHYTAENLAGKADCRRDLLHAFGASHVAEDVAVLGVMSRFATQKGFDLLAAIAEQLMQRPVILTVLGTGEAYYENLLRGLHERYPEKFAVRVMYDEALAHKVEAGADISLMPSKYEPCGLTHIYSLKYGTVPVVRATGGLDDTVEEWNAAAGTGNGFKFERYDAGEFVGAIDRALAAFRDKEQWHRLMRNGMASDFSWTKPVREYAKVYEEVAQMRS